MLSHLYCTKRVRVKDEDEEKEFELFYYLIERENNEVIEYGVEVKLNKNNIITNAEINSFTTVKEYADRFLDFLANGLVTPVSLYEITDDYLA